ncbi:Ig-like domain-containing protein [Flavobacterium seoulense]|uniref:Ig-like domain-containing protein n=1 Tax=Flavobacterium seoulense TaxID=1492738 RepID=A0A066WS08_9FLAO|nr:T9SS sorting signal type C domain-containing protein [Flavobacterium seoulense]KDN56606.1 hypothetical protein FEM21_01090 [Flavobacterium seoulense]
MKKNYFLYINYWTLVLLLVSFLSFGQSPQTYNSSGTFTVPAGVINVNVQVWGAGGAGGGSTANGNGGSGGGSGGYTTNPSFSVSPNTSINYTVGIGGIGSTGVNGTSGGQSTFSSLIANGGTGGTANSGSGGVGGTATGGSTNTIGSVGGNGGGNTGGNGGNAPASGGTGGSGRSNTNGNVGNSPGGGGGGGEADYYYDPVWYDWFRYSTDPYGGGNGGNGQVRVSWTCPTYALTSAASATPICSGGTSTVTLTSTTLPAGTYTVTYNTSSSPTSTGNTAIMTFSDGTGTFVTRTLTAASTITVTNLSSGTAPSICSSAISSNNTAMVTVNTSSVAPTGITGTTTICNGSSTTLTVNGGTLGTGATAQWFTGSCGGTSVGTGNSITVSPTSNTTYYVRYSGTCNTTTCASQLVTVETLPVVNAGADVCRTNNGNFTLSGFSPSGGTWTRVSGTANVTSAGGVSNVTSPSTTIFRYTVTNSCGSVSDDVVVSRGNPDTPGLIAGPLTACQGAIGLVYSVSAVANATSYNWFFPDSNWQITSGAGTNSVTVRLNSGAGTGNVYVSASNGCGTGNARYDKWVVVSTPTIAGTVTPANTNVCSSSNSTNLSLNGNTGSVLRWESSLDNFAGGTITTINSTGSSITASNVTVDTYYRAVVQNGGCDVQYSNSVKITVYGSLTTPSSISGLSAQCAGNTSQVYSVNPVTNATSYNWTLPANWTIISGSGTNSITVNIPNNGATGNVSVNAANTGCGTSNSISQWVVVSSATIAGTVTPANTNVCLPGNSTNLSLNGNTGSILRWESSLDNFSGGTITTINSTGSPITASNVTVDTYYRAVVQNGGCNIQYSNSVKITVYGAVAVPGAISMNGVAYPENGNANYCPSSSVVLSINPVPNATTYVWTTPPGWTLVSGQGTTSATYITGNSSQSENVTVSASNSSICNSPGSRYFYLYLGNVSSPISITTQPSTPTATCSGSGTQTMSVVATGSGLTYQWRKDGINISNGGVVSGATTATLILTNPTTADAGSYDVVVSGTCTPSVTSTARTVTINTVPVVTTASAQSFCGSATVANLTGTASSGSVIDWYANSSGGTALTSGTALSSTTYYAQSRNTTTGCVSSTRTSVVVTINTVPAAPIVGTITQPNCSVLTGSVNLSGLPSSGSWIITATPATAGLTGTGATTTITGLTGGTTYTFTVSNGSCNSSASANVVINIPPALVTWNGSNWSSTPTINNRVEFLANYSSGSNANSPANVDACSCQVKNNAVVVFNTGHTLKVINELQVVAGTLTFEDDASLVQVNDAALNSGNIIYKRVTLPLNRYDFTYWSSPVKDMSLGLPSVGLSPTTFYDKYFIYNNAWVSVPRTTVMIKGEGYSVRAPQTTAIIGNPLPFLATFTGEPHNGEVKKTLTGNRVYLIGNPYPSAIDADQFLALNSSVLQGTLYFWTHNSPPSDAFVGDKRYNYTTNDYATYNRTGGVGTGKAATTGGLPPSGKIASAQGFFAPASAAGGELVFNNLMRLSTTGAVLDNTQFFKLSTNSKTAKTITTAKTEKNRIWLNLTNSEGAFKQTLIGYVTGATNDYDGAFDGVTYDGNQFIDFYSVNNEVNLSIQGRALPFVKKDSVALGYKSTIKGDFKISIDQIDGSLATQNIFLEDKDLKVLHDLKKEAYTFSTEKGVFNNRFVLRYADKNAVDEVIVPEVPGKDSNAAVIVSVKNGEIKINATATKLDKVIVYDMAGRKLFQKNKVDTNILVIPNFFWNHQGLVVDIVLTDGTKHSRKIIN